jgi:iron complex outermembrane receptor protein
MQYPQLLALLALLAIVLSARPLVQAQEAAPPPAATPPTKEAPAEPKPPGEEQQQAPAAPAEPAAPEPAAPEPASEVAPAAPAQPVQSAQPIQPIQEEETSEDAMVVTGSRIKRSPELSKSAPVEVIDRKTLERMGATNTADIIQTLTSSQGAGFQGGGNVINNGGGALGTASVNLRGLGAGATLVLVNGRRLVPSAGASSEAFGDISVIPLSAIERIEVLKGGGSAIYGADAVGGVINIITRSTFEGVRVELDGQGTTRADQGDVTVSGAFGAKSERARAMIAMSYFRRSELLSNKRPYSKAANVDSNGNPGTFLIPGYDPNDPTRTRFVDPGCSQAEDSMVVNSVVNGMTTSDQSCVFNFSKFYPLLVGAERANAFANASYDLTNHSTVFTELLVNRSRSEYTGLPSYPVPPPLLFIPASHVDNPFGRDVQMIGRPLGAAAGAQRNMVGDDTLRAVVGLRGDFADIGADTIFETWEWELTGSWGISRYTSMLSDSLRAPLQNSINSCSDPANLSGCFNPFYSSVDGTGTPNSQAVINSFMGTATNITEQALQTYNAGMTGSLFKLPGGDLALAFGGEYRHEWRASQEDHDATEQHYSFLIGYTDAKAQRDIYSGYLELRWPFYRGIELQTAARIEHYSDIQQSTPSPFAGLTLGVGDIIGKDKAPAIVRRLQFTGQVTSAFRAPTLYQAFPGSAVVPTLLTVPGSPIPAFVPVQVFGNPHLQPETALILSGGFSWQPINELTLMAEIWTYDYKNRIAAESAQQALANDVYQMTMGGSDPRVVRDPASGQISRIQVTNQNIEGHVTTSGIDFGAFVTLTGESFGGSRNDWGALTFGTQGTLTLSYTFPIEQSAPLNVPNTVPTVTFNPPPHCSGSTCQAVGSRNYGNFAPPLPRWRFNIPINWSYLGHSATVMGHYTSGIDNDNDIHTDGTLGRFPGILTVDMQYAYTIRNWLGKECTFRIGVYNIVDTPPPATHDTNGYETLLYDPRGRMVYAKVAATF